ILLKKTGPLVAPSANPQGLTPALTIAQAKKYFGNHVDFYVNAGTLRSKSSTLVAIEKGNLIIKRFGAVKIK
ncbi:MAG: Sua5/YciO/YrdC/YwlC family protein, partial [bacterium]|nr:Sua5/YciO/YrdC/YwlC family protein [bacterium]